MADEVPSIEIELAHAGIELSDASAEALDAGANLALVGDELIQFAQAEPVTPTRSRLSGLWRGRRGTEDAVGTGAVGDRFVLIEREALIALDGRGAAGMALTVMATGVGDPEPEVVEVAMSGRSAIPLTPVALQVSPVEGGRLLRWTRRSRVGWRWSDGTDAPLGESIERYQLRFVRSGVPDIVVLSEAAEWLLTGGDALTVEVRQAGDHGLSPPATVILDEME